MKNKVTRYNQLNRTKKVNNKYVILNLYYLSKKSTLSIKCQITVLTNHNGDFLHHGHCLSVPIHS